MNLFNAIEKLRGENLASAILRYLVINCAEFQAEFLALIDSESPIGPIISDSHFSCYLEESTITKNEDVEQVRGRIDVVLEVDNAVIGIEAKFYAGFQEDQPFKYLDSLADKALSLKGLRRAAEYGHFILILVPDSRVSRVSKAVRSADKPDDAKRRCKVISWNDIQNCLEKAEEETTPEFAYLSKMYRKFLSGRLNLFDGWNRSLPHLLRRWQPGGTVLQGEVIDDIYQVVVPPLEDVFKNRKSSAKDYSIHNFAVKDEDNVDHWVCYGFCRQGMVSGTDGDGAEFFVASTLQPSESALDHKIITTKGKDHKFTWWHEGRFFAWLVDIEKIDGNPDSWSRVLNPFYVHLLEKTINRPTAD